MILLVNGEVPLGVTGLTILKAKNCPIKTTNIDNIINYLLFKAELQVEVAVIIRKSRLL